MNTLNTTVATCAFLITVNINYQSWRCTIKQLTLVRAADPTQIMSSGGSRGSSLGSDEPPFLFLEAKILVYLNCLLRL